MFKHYRDFKKAQTIHHSLKTQIKSGFNVSEDGLILIYKYHDILKPSFIEFKKILNLQNAKATNEKIINDLIAKNSIIDNLNLRKLPRDMSLEKSFDGINIIRLIELYDELSVELSHYKINEPGIGVFFSWLMSLLAMVMLTPIVLNDISNSGIITLSVIPLIGAGVGAPGIFNAFYRKKSLYCMSLATISIIDLVDDSVNVFESPHFVHKIYESYVNNE